MADKWSQYEEKPAGDKWAAYEEKPTPVATAGERTPIWESLVRGLSQSATLGFGDEAQAALRSVPEFLTPGKSGVETYKRLRDEERAANERAAQSNPVSYGVGGLAAAIPQALGLGGAIKAIPTVLGKVGTGAGAGAAVGGIAGAGGAKEVSDIPAEAGRGAAIGAAVGGGLPAVGAGAGRAVEKSNVLKRFAENYRGLRPEVTGGIGPVMIGGTAGAVTPTVSGGLGGPGIRPEDWSTDPYSAALKSAEFGLYGALAGQTLKSAGRVGGAVQKTMRGEGGPPRAPAGLDSVDARKAAMAQQSTLAGRVQTNSDNPVTKTMDNIKSMSQSARGMVDELKKWKQPATTPTAAPQSQNLSWPKIMTPEELDQELLVRKLKEMPASQTNPWERVVQELSKKRD